MILNDGTKMNYGTIRVTPNMSKLIYHTGTGLRDYTSLMQPKRQNKRQKN